MLRPLPPFRVRPLKKVTIRKASPADPVCELTENALIVSIKGLRRPLKAGRQIAAARLKVLGREAIDHA